MGRCLAILLLPLCLLPTGCVTLGCLVSDDKAPPTGAVCQVMATWNNQVVHTPDPMHGGESIPGIAGRLYLFGPNVDFPMAGDGCLVVDLYDEAQGGPGKTATPLEEWRLDKDTLQRLLRKDAIGWGYSLFLPWGTYKPEICRIRLKVRYEPAKGIPLYAEGSPLTLDNGETSSLLTTASLDKSGRQAIRPASHRE